MKGRYMLLFWICCFICCRSYFLLERKNEMFAVEGIHCTLEDLSRYDFQRTVVYNSFRETLYCSEIIGISADEARKFRYSNMMPFYTTNLWGDSFIFPALYSKSRPVLRYFELYDYDGDIYVKVYFCTDRYNGGYHAVYVYAEQAEQKLRQFFAEA